VRTPRVRRRRTAFR